MKYKEKTMEQLIRELEDFQSKFQKQREFFDTVIESFPYPFYIINVRDYSIVIANSAVFDGTDREGLSCYELTHKNGKPCDDKKYICPIKRIIKTKKPIIVEHQHYDKDGNRRYYEVHGYPIFDENDNVTQMIEYALDITDRKEAEKAIKEYTRELEDANHLKDIFMDIMQHDLLNPIGIARGYIHIMLDDERDPNKNAYLECIKENLSKAEDMIKNATKLSKLECSESIELEELDLKEIIRGVVNNFKPIADEAEMKIENNITHSITIKANAIIEEAFSNLISNAIKYAPEGERIVIEGEEKDNFWRIKIIDFGDGIADENKKRIFDRFKRKAKRGVKGTGLGLAIAKRIIELHKGRIWIEDNPKNGAVFIVEIPKFHQNMSCRDFTLL